MSDAKTSRAPQVDSTPPRSRRGQPPGVKMRAEMVRLGREALGLTRERFCIQASTPAAPLTVHTLKQAEKGVGINRSAAVQIAQGLGLPYFAVVHPDPAYLALCIAQAGCQPPPIPVHPWIGRSGELEQLVTRLTTAGESTRLRLLGPPGIGKTVLALRALADPGVQRRFEDGIIWLPTAGRRDEVVVESMTSGLVHALALERFLNHLESSPERFAAALRYQLASRQVLLVLDDLRLTQLPDHLLDRGTGHLLITTCARSIGHELSETIELAPLDEAQGHSLLARHLEPRRLERETEGARALLQVLGGIPAQLQQVGAWLAHEPLVTLADCAVHFSRGEPSWLASLQRRLEPTTRRVFDQLRIFGATPFSVRWVAGAAEIPVAEAARALSELADLHLIRACAAATEFPLHDQPFCLEPAGGPVLPEDAGEAALRRGAQQVARSLNQASLADRRASFTGFRALWTRVLDRLAEEVELNQGATRPLMHPEQEGLGRTATPPELDELILALDPVLGTAAPSRSRRWWQAAFGGQGSEGVRGLCALRLGQQLYPDFAAALPWLQWAGAALERVGELARAALAWTEVGKISHGLERFEEGNAALARAVWLSRRAGEPPTTLAVRLNNQALALFLLPSAAPPYPEVDDLLAEAERTLDPGATGLEPISWYVRWIIRLNRLLVSTLAGQPLAPVADTLAAFLAALPDHSLYGTFPVLSFGQLGQPGPCADYLAWSRHRWEQGYDVETAAIDRTFQPLSCVITNLLALLNTRLAEGAGSPRRLPVAPAIIDASHEQPELIEGAGSLAMLYLRDPFLRLFDAGLCGRALGFLEHCCGPAHVATQRCRELLDWHQRFPESDES